jgi:peptidoglycan/LPS O-acetylase OafA/YrhL
MFRPKITAQVAFRSAMEPDSTRREGNWIDGKYKYNFPYQYADFKGIRGIAALTVVVYHLMTCFTPFSNSPAIAENGTMEFLQWPIIRVIPAGGQTVVALFFLVTGYSNSVSAFTRIHSGNHGGALVHVGKAALGRSLRIVLPTAIAILIAFVLTHTGAFFLVDKVDTLWIERSATPHAHTPLAALRDLFFGVLNTYTQGRCSYDPVQWTQRHLLEASMLVYLIILATSTVTRKARWIILVVLYFFGWMGEQYFKTMNILVGIAIAELHVALGPNAPRRVPAPVAAFFIFLGLFLASYPDDQPHWSSWSRFIMNTIRPLIPAGADQTRYTNSLAASFLCLGIFFSTRAREFLTTGLFTFLGRVSFPVYLIHNTVIRAILVPILYLPDYLKKRDIPFNEGKLKRGGSRAFMVGIPVFFISLYWFAWLWTLYIDPPITRVCKRFVAWACAEEMVQDKEKMPLLGAERMV